MLHIIIDDTKKFEVTSYMFNEIMNILGYSYELSQFKDQNVNKNNIKIIYSSKKFKELNQKYIQNPIIFIPANKFRNKLSYSKRNKDIIFNSDFIKKSFDILNRKEEINNANVDEHNRFKANNSRIYNRLQDPPINNCILLLNKAIKRLAIENNIILIKKCLWPNNKEYAVCLTHDVDVAYKYNLIGAAIQFKKSMSLLSQFKIRSFLSNAIHIAKNFLLKKNPYWQFENIINIESEYQWSSTFFFSTGKKHKLDPNYSISDSRIRAIIQKLNKRGFEIGLHSTYDAYENHKILHDEKNNIEYILKCKILGCRSHFLRFNVLKSWNYLQKTGFTYDTSLGYTSNIGFRGGICHPFYPFNYSDNKRFDLVEIPLAVMDGALITEYKKLSIAWKKLKNLILKVRKFNGLITLDWHQRLFYDKEFKIYSKLYKRCLELFKQQNAFVTNAKSITNWWDLRSKITIKLISSKKSKNSYNIVTVKKINNFCIKICNKNKKEVILKNNKYYNLSQIDNDIVIQFLQLFPNKPVKLVINNPE